MRKFYRNLKFLNKVTQTASIIPTLMASPCPKYPILLRGLPCSICSNPSSSNKTRIRTCKMFLSRWRISMLRLPKPQLSAIRSKMLSWPDAILMAFRACKQLVSRSCQVMACSKGSDLRNVTSNIRTARSMDAPYLLAKMTDLALAVDQPPVVKPGPRSMIL